MVIYFKNVNDVLWLKIERFISPFLLGRFQNNGNNIEFKHYLYFYIL